MRVATLNVFGHNGSWSERQPCLVDGFRDLRPDLVAFQEAMTSDDRDQITEILGDGFHVAHQTLNLLGDGNHGASIASRWPIAAIHEVDLRVSPGSAGYPCGALIVRVTAPAPIGPVLFVAHGPWYPWWAEHDRERQAVVLARGIEPLVGDHPHVIVAGDFNAEADAASLRFMTGRQSLDGLSVRYLDVWHQMHPTEPGHTFSPDNPLTRIDEPRLRTGRRVDYLLMRCTDHGPTLDVINCELIFDRPIDGVWPSDHFGVMADLEGWA